MREVEGSRSSLTNTHGLKIIGDNLLPFYDIKNWIDILVFSDKDEETVGLSPVGFWVEDVNFPRTRLLCGGCPPLGWDGWLLSYV